MPAVFGQFPGEPERLAIFEFYACLDHGSQVRVLGVIAGAGKKPVAAGDQLGDAEGCRDLSFHAGDGFL